MPAHGSLGPWVVLAAFCWTSATNGFMFMNFSSDESLSAHALGTDSAGVAWLYSAALLAVMAGFVPSAVALARCPRVALLAMAAMQALSGWLRQRGDYRSAVVSSFGIGMAGSVIICAYTSLAERWFPPQQRGLATALAVQSNYAGWGLGAFTPLVVDDEASLGSFLAAQAWPVAAAAPLMALALVTAPAPSPARLSAVSVPRSPQYWLHAFCYSLLGGVSFAIPAVQDELFRGLGLGTRHTMWTNFVFCGAGVVGGVGLGSGLVRDRASVLRVLFGIAAVAVTLLTQAHAFPFPALVLLMATAGASSLGFIGLALRVAVDVGGVPETYAGGAVELLIQAWGALLTQASAAAGFAACAGATLAAAAGLLLARFPAEGSEPLAREWNGCADLAVPFQNGCADRVVQA